jgi:uncharacterized membrane protein
MSHRALIGLVVVSIALNLLLAGLIGGHMLREGRHSPPPLAWAFKDVPKGVREKARPILREHSREVIAARRDVRQSERALRKLLQSETLTREALEVGLADMRRSTADYHELIHEVGIDVLLSLDAKERMRAAPYLFNQTGRQGGARQAGPEGADRRSRMPPPEGN